MNVNPLRPPCLYCGERTQLTYEDGWLHAATGSPFCELSAVEIMSSPIRDLRTSTVATPNMTSVRYLAGCMVLGGFVFAAFIAIALAAALLADAFAQSEEEARQARLEASLEVAMERWGVRGVAVTVALAEPSQAGWRAEAWPTAHLGPCEIRVHPGLDESEWPATLVHEYGHCLGYVGESGGPHSADVGSVMYPAPASWQVITAADRLAVRSGLAWLPVRVRAMEVGR